VKNDSGIFREILTGFVGEEDPLLSMLKWMMDQLMQIEAEQKIGANKGKHNSRGKGYGDNDNPKSYPFYVKLRYNVNNPSAIPAEKSMPMIFTITEPGITILRLRGLSLRIR